MAYEERAREAQRLAPAAGTPVVDDRLLALLLDPEDTAVSQAAADALLDRGDLTALRLYVAAFGVAEDDTRNHLGDCLYDDSGLRWSAVARQVPALLADAQPQVRRGAVELAAHMRLQAQHHTR